MKSAYELAMERLEKEVPSSQKKLTDDQKKRLGEIEDEYQAKLAERRILAQRNIQELRMQGKFDEAQSAEEELGNDIRKLEEEKDHKKNKVRQEGE